MRDTEGDRCCLREKDPLDLRPEYQKLREISCRLSMRFLAGCFSLLQAYSPYVFHLGYDNCWIGGEDGGAYVGRDSEQAFMDSQIRGYLTRAGLSTAWPVDNITHLI